MTISFGNLGSLKEFREELEKSGFQLTLKQEDERKEMKVSFGYDSHLESYAVDVYGVLLVEIEFPVWNKKEAFEGNMLFWELYAKENGYKAVVVRYNPLKEFDFGYEEIIQEEKKLLVSWLRRNRLYEKERYWKKEIEKGVIEKGFQVLETVKGWFEERAKIDFSLVYVAEQPAYFKHEGFHAILKVDFKEMDIVVIKEQKELYRVSGKELTKIEENLNKMFADISTKQREKQKIEPNIEYLHYYLSKITNLTKEQVSKVFDIVVKDYQNFEIEKWAAKAKSMPGRVSVNAGLTRTNHKGFYFKNVYFEDIAVFNILNYLFIFEKGKKEDKIKYFVLNEKENEKVVEEFSNVVKKKLEDRIKKEITHLSKQVKQLNI